MSEERQEIKMSETKQMEDKMNETTVVPGDCWDRDDESRDGVIRGTRLRFVNGEFLDRDDNPVPLGTRLLAYEVDVVLQMFKDGKPTTRRRDPKTGKLDNPDMLNDKIPVTEWEISRFTKQPDPPWKKYVLIYFVGPTGEEWSFINQTNGAFQAYDALKSRMRNLKKFYDVSGVPLVELQVHHWNSPTFGPQIRPEFKIIEVRPTNNRQAIAAEPVKQIEHTNPEPAQEDRPASVTEALDQFAGQTASPPTLREELKDEIPW
jgi:hypothetical protein